MTVVCGQLLGCCDLISNEVDRIEVVCQADEVLVVLHVARTPTIDAVMDVGRTGGKAEGHIPATDCKPLFDVARRQRKI